MWVEKRKSDQSAPRISQNVGRKTEKCTRNDDEKYRSHACEKLRLYCQNGIIPSINLIMTFETRENPLSTEKIESIIKEYFG
jgi:hypothetical protein